MCSAIVLSFCELWNAPLNFSVFMLWSKTQWSEYSAGTINNTEQFTAVVGNTALSPPQSTKEIKSTPHQIATEFEMQWEIMTNTSDFTSSTNYSQKIQAVKIDRGCHVTSFLSAPLQTPHSSLTHTNPFHLHVPELSVWKGLLPLSSLLLLRIIDNKEDCDKKNCNYMLG